MKQLARENILDYIKGFIAEEINFQYLLKKIDDNLNGLEMSVREDERIRLKKKFDKWFLKGTEPIESVIKRLLTKI